MACRRCPLCALLIVALVGIAPTVAVSLTKQLSSQQVATLDVQPHPQEQPKPVEFMILCNIFLKMKGAMQKRWFMDDGTWKLSENGDVMSLNNLSESAKNSSMEVTLFYDKVPEAMLKPLGPHFHFYQVDLEDFNSTHNTPANSRFFFYQREIRKHPEWKNVFLTDAIDLHVGFCCPGFQPGVLYIGSEQRTAWDKRLKNDWWKVQFTNMGGKWLKWWEELSEKVDIHGRARNQNETMSINDGIVGGSRDITLEFLGYMTDILSDRGIATRWGWRNIDMPASAYITYNFFADRHHYGEPVHSLFNRWQHWRQDVWFVHK